VHKKRVYSHKWDISILEQVAANCNIMASAQTEKDWELFLEAIYEGIQILSSRQRTVLLLSQEFGLSFVDIGRVLNIPLSTVIGNLKAAIERLVFILRSRSLTRKDMFNCKALQKIYTGTIDLKECSHEPAEFEFLDRYQPPFFHPRNYLQDDAGEPEPPQPTPAGGAKRRSLQPSPGRGERRGPKR